MRINYNISAINTNNVLKRNDDALSSSIEKLSSGLKINHAKDNPAGLAISKRMNAQLEGLTVATQNASDGISVIETAESALAEIQDMLQRINELAVQASNGTSTTADRQAVQAEVMQLQDEIERVSKDTEFNGQSLLDGTFDLKGYSDEEGIKVDYYSDSVKISTYSLTAITPGYVGAGGVYVDATANLLNADGSAIAGLKAKSDGDTITFTGDDDFEVRVTIDPATTAATANLDMTGIGAMRLQIGSNQDQILEVRIPEISLENIGVAGIDVSTLDGARKALDKMQDSINYISEVRSKLGAYENRLEHASSYLESSNDNLTASYSRIMDTNMASEMTEYTKLQVLSEAGTSMLAQANERPQQVLQLLQ